MVINQAFGRLPKPTDDRLQSIIGTTLLIPIDARTMESSFSVGSPRKNVAAIPAMSRCDVPLEKVTLQSHVERCIVTKQGSVCYGQHLAPLPTTD